MERSANKTLGQHWLDDYESLTAVTDAARVYEGDMVLEIGPGHGSLTEVLLERGAEVLACEVDGQLAQELEKRASKEAWALTVVEEDIRKLDFTQLPQNYKVAANIPYYLTSHIIQLLLEQAHKPQAIGLLIQKEVAERAAAKPGSMSLLSVSAQFYADVALGPVIPKELFQPPPKVDSQVLSLTPKSNLPNVKTADFFRVVKAGFSERRKKLTNALSGGLRLPKEQAEQLVVAAGLSPTARAQELTIEQWLTLYGEWSRITKDA